MIRENGNAGQVIQVFVPTNRLSTNSTPVKHGNVVRFSAAGQYTLNGTGVKVPFGAGMTMGIPFGATNLELFDAETGGTPTAQVIEIM